MTEKHNHNRKQVWSIYAEIAWISKQTKKKRGKNFSSRCNIWVEI